jgi:hypothetical protein
MTSKQKQKAALKAMMRPMIKEEVTKIIQQVLPSLLAESLSDALPILMEEMKDDRKMSLRGALNETAVPTQQAPMHQSDVKFSSNPVLNEVLKNTQGGVPQETAPAHYMNSAMPMMNPNQVMPDAYPTEEAFHEDYGPMDDYEPTNVNPAMMAQMNAKMGNMIPETNTNGAPNTVSPTELATQAPGVFKAITKDYSGVMKAMDAKKNMGESNIDFSQLPPSDALK